MFARIAATLTAILIAGQLAAQSEPLETLTSFQDVREWQAVGRIDMLGKGTCTGTLIEADLVLTAAHCLTDDTGALLDAENIIFRAAYRNGTASATATGIAIAIPNSYDPQSRYRSERYGADVGLLRLSQPIPSALVRPIRVAHLADSDTSIAVVSYGADRNEAPSLQRNCDILERTESVVFMNCEATFGSSGAPVLILRNGSLRVASVLTTTFSHMGQRVTSGVRFTQFLPGLRRRVNYGGGGRSNQTTTITILGVGERSQSNVGFVTITR